MKGPSYEAILSSIEGLAGAHPDLVQVLEYGKSVQGRPLKMVIVMRAGDFPKRSALLMTGSTHGDEYLGIEDKIPFELVKKSQESVGIKRFLDRGGAFVFVPVLNPDGFAVHSRLNAHGADLNRDWDLPKAGYSGFKEVETQALRDQLEVMTGPGFHFRYDISVDYHCCLGAVLYPWSHSKDKIPRQDLIAHEQIARLAMGQIGIEAGITGDKLGYFPKGTSKDYYYSRFGTLAFTYEGRHGQEDTALNDHVKWWESLTRVAQ